MDIFVDSGAPTLYNTMIRRNKNSGVMGSSMADRKYDDFSFIKTEEYKAYREKYIKFLLQHESKITLYANLDVINNAEATWENQKMFEERGLKPIPVFHFGSDVKWLKRYLNEGYEYLAMGGLIPNSYSVLRKPLDSMWSKYLTDSKGYPKIKVHGFAVTSPRLVHRYPWYSVDSTSWVKFGMYGAIVVPRKIRGTHDYKSAPIVVMLSERSPTKDQPGKHFSSMSAHEQREIIKYIEMKGFSLGKSELLKKEVGYKPKKGETIIKKTKRFFLVEKVIDLGVCNNNIMRDTLNAMYFTDLCKSVPEYPWPIKFKKRGLL